MTTTTTLVKFSSADWAVLDSTNKDYLRLAELIGKGYKWAEAIASSGVGYASGWLFAQRQAFKAEGTLVDLVGKSDAEAAKVVKALRLEGRQQSWGEIMARTGLTEGSARSLFTSTTNVASEGLRNGKGGRYFQGNAEAYIPAPKVGWVRPTEAGVKLPEEILAGLLAAGALETSDAEELQSMTAKDLKAMAKSLGLRTSGSKAELVTAIAEAYAA